MCVFPGDLQVGSWRGIGPQIERVHGMCVIFMFDLIEWAPSSSHMVRCALYGLAHACASRSLVYRNFLF